MTFVDITPLQEDLVDAAHQVQFQYKGSHLHLLVEFPASSPSAEVKHRLEQALIRCQLPGIRHVLIYGRSTRADAIEWRLGFQVKLGPHSAKEGRIRTLKEEVHPLLEEEIPTEIKILELPSLPDITHPMASTPRWSSGKRRKRNRFHTRWHRGFGTLLIPLYGHFLPKVLAGSAVGVILVFAFWKGWDLMTTYNQPAEESRSETSQF